MCAQPAAYKRAKSTERKAPQMTDKPESPFKLNRTRIFILAMGALVLLISISMFSGGLGTYNALKEAANAAKTPTAEQVEGAQ